MDSKISLTIALLALLSGQSKACNAGNGITGIGYTNTDMTGNGINDQCSGQRRNRARTASTQEDLRYNKLAALSNQETLKEILQTITIPRFERAPRSDCEM